MTQDTTREALANLPKFPTHPEPHTYTWTALELRTIEEYGQACARAALSSQPPAPKTGALTDEEWQQIADETETLIWGRVRRAIDAKLEARASAPSTEGAAPTARYRDVLEEMDDDVQMLMDRDMGDN